MMEESKGDQRFSEGVVKKEGIREITMEIGLS